MKTNDIPKAHPSLLDALRRQDEQARKMKLSEGFTEKVMEKVKTMNEESKSAATAESQSYPSSVIRPSFFQKIAAVFFVAAFLGGLVFAAYHVLFPHTDLHDTSIALRRDAPDSEDKNETDSLIRFSDVRLDSILSVVSKHYGKQVCFRDNKPKAMRLITTWNTADSLGAFIEHINMFDYMHLTLMEDTIFVDETLPLPSL